MLYKKQQATKSKFNINNSYQGETIEQKVNRIVNNKEPIKDGAPQIFTDRKDGVIPEFDIRTDRFEIAVEAHDIIAKSHITKRQEFAKKLEEINNPKPKEEPKTETKNSGEPGPAPATDQK